MKTNNFIEKGLPFINIKSITKNDNNSKNKCPDTYNINNDNSIS